MFLNQDTTLLNVKSSFNINGMIFVLTYFLIFYCFVPNLRKSISLDGLIWSSNSTKNVLCLINGFNILASHR